MPSSRRSSGGAAGAFELPEGTIYPVLHRLEHAGLLAGRWVTADSGQTAAGLCADEAWQARARASAARCGSNFPTRSAGCSRGAGRGRTRRDFRIRRPLARKLAFDPALARARAAGGRGSSVGGRRRRSGGRSTGGRAARDREFRRPRRASRPSSRWCRSRGKPGGSASSPCAVIAAVFVAMKARLTWYVVTESASVRMGALGEIVVSIDRYAFWLSIVVGDRGLGVHRQPPGAPRLTSGIPEAASSIRAPVPGGGGRPDRVGHQRRRAHLLAAGRNPRIASMF